MRGTNEERFPETIRGAWRIGAGRGAADHEKNGEKSDEMKTVLQVQQDVVDELRFEPAVESTKIGVGGTGSPQCCRQLDALQSIEPANGPQLLSLTTRRPPIATFLLPDREGRLAV